MDSNEITLALLIDEMYNEYTRTLTQGAIKAAKELGVSIIIYGVGALESPLKFSGMRNSSISLINPDDLQGIIYSSASLSNFIGKEKYLKFPEKYRQIPSIHIGIENPDLVSINIDNMKAMYDLVSHMIKVHGKKNIAYINGKTGVQESDERFAGFRKALHDNGIEFDERLVYDGFFLRNRGILAIEEFLDKRNLKFDALVAANDHMAIYAMNELQNRGFNIPDDISVAGFDNLISAKSCFPPLTTVNQPVYELGYNAVKNLVLSIVTGSKIDNISMPGRLVIRESCGCLNNYEDASGIKNSEEISSSLLEEMYTTIHVMTRSIIGTFEETELFSVLDETLKNFRIKEFSIAKYIDSKNSISVFSNYSGIGSVFPSKQLVENKIESFMRPFCKILLPLYYRNEKIGFFVSDARTDTLSILEIIRDHLSGSIKGTYLVRELKKHAENLEMQVNKRTEELKEANKKLEELSYKDELTGLLNRRGFLSAAERQIRFLKRNKNILIVYIDLDDLKVINDSHGHAAGDVAIKVMAEILVKAFRETDIIARPGGDEFTILMTDCSMEDYMTICRRANQMVDEYNSSNMYKFTLSFSSGAAPSDPKNFISLEELIKEADSNLYEEKKRKKTARIKKPQNYLK
ncbi:MAG: diguanylate cyclase [Spirochaetes bacterium]|nr:diguanylate cyclase [Spirochaetota bacterium]